jgi:ABC-2 type transport system permease protein
MVVIMPLMAPMYLLYQIISDPDGVLVRVLSFIPFTAPVTMMFRLAVGGSSILETLASLTLMLVTGIVLLWVSARVFRAGILMYGQRMSLRTVMTVLRKSG